MSSIDEENLRRADHEVQKSVVRSNDGSGAMWFLIAVVIVAIIGGMYVYGSGGADTEAEIDAPTPAISEEVAPVVTPVE